jgi:formate--tetrahydrofolate ligase
VSVEANGPWRIDRIAEKLGLSADDIEPYGSYTAKVKLSRLPSAGTPPRGKLILVTATTPTSHGEGKTVVSIGLAQAIEKMGNRSIVTLREPSLGPVFGIKGGATGGGRARVLPSEKINLHFNGDMHAITAAHNLLAAIIDSHLHHGNELGLDADNVFWPRSMDMNDRALRHVIIGLGGKANGVPRETRFVITAASEVMAALALAESREDCRGRLDNITIGFGLDGRAVRAGDLRATGAMMVLLNDALMPNLVQTSEHTPALVHAGPFANIAHGTSSVIAQKIALQLVDYVVNESGFGADLGAEKYFDIVMPTSGLKPAAAVLVTTVRAMRAQSGSSPAPASLGSGLENLLRHIENLKKFAIPTVVAINRFAGDEAAEVREIREFCAARGVECAEADVFEKGASGGLELAAAVIAAATKANPGGPRPLYSPELGLQEKIEIVAKEIYGAASVYVESAARKKIDKFATLGFAKLPICMAKTPASFSDDPKKLGAPKNWTFTVTDAHLASGAGFIVIAAGNTMLMPGLSRSPQALRMNVDGAGKITGLS